MSIPIAVLALITKTAALFSYSWPFILTYVSHSNVEIELLSHPRAKLCRHASGRTGTAL